MSGSARGYSRPPFEPGNLVAVRHGAYSPRRVDPLAAELVRVVSDDVNWWRPCDLPAVWAWARTEARVQLLGEYLAERGGDLDDDGTVRPAADLLSRLEARAESLRARLGLDPLARARLGRDSAAASADLEVLKSEGARLLEARSAALDTLPVPAEANDRPELPSEAP